MCSLTEFTKEFRLQLEARCKSVNIPLLGILTGKELEFEGHPMTRCALAVDEWNGTPQQISHMIDNFFEEQPKAISNLEIFDQPMLKQIVVTMYMA